MAAETDPKKIAAALEGTKQARLAARPKSYEDAVDQILRHSLEAGRITDEEFRQKWEESMDFIRAQRTEFPEDSN